MLFSLGLSGEGLSAPPPKRRLERRFLRILALMDCYLEQVAFQVPTIKLRIEILSSLWWWGGGGVRCTLFLICEMNPWDLMGPITTRETSTNWSTDCTINTMYTNPPAPNLPLAPPQSPNLQMDVFWLFVRAEAVHFLGPTILSQVSDCRMHGVHVRIDRRIVQTPNSPPPTAVWNESSLQSLKRAPGYFHTSYVNTSWGTGTLLLHQTS